MTTETISKTQIEEEVRPVFKYTYFQEIIKKHKDLIWKVVECEEDGVTPKEVEIQKLKKNKKLFWFCLHFINGVKTAGIFTEGVQYCCHCKTQPLNEANQGGLLNTSGYCNAYLKHENCVVALFCCVTANTTGFAFEMNTAVPTGVEKTSLVSFVQRLRLTVTTILNLSLIHI